MITGQHPVPGGELAVDQDLAVQFNRVLDFSQVEDQNANLIEVTLDDVPVAGNVSQMVNNDGSRLIFRPLQAFLDARQYQVRISPLVRDLHGNELGEEYRFRFVASSQATPQLTSILPVSGSWRGGDVITLRGSGFGSDTEVEIGALPIAASDILVRHEDEIQFRVPGLVASPQQNLLVGLTLRNGPNEFFRGGAFTYVADPFIDAIGQYDRSTGVFNGADHLFVYNAGEAFAIRGRGLGEYTRVRINGREVTDVRVESADLISMPLPLNTLGELLVEISNGDFADDTLQNRDLNIELDFNLRIDAGAQYAVQHGDLLATAFLNEVRLFSVRDSAAPLYLSKLDASGAIHGLAMDEQSLVVLSGDRRDVQVFDISNLYAPQSANSLINNRGVDYQDLHFAAGNIYVRAGDELYYGSSLSPELASLALRQAGEPELVSINVDSKALYILFADRLEARDLQDPSRLVASYYHGFAAADGMLLSDNRIALTAISRLELLSI
ncbi:MAG: IPT/TIG domain-containing protein, partial [Candidatus Thiodiazotropha lotti]